MKGRKQYHYLSLVCVGLLSSAIPFVVAQNTEMPTDSHGMQYVSGELIVKFKDTRVDLERSRGMQTLSLMEEQQDFETEDTLPKENIALISVDPNTNLQDQITLLAADPNVEYAQLNLIYEVFSEAPNDPGFSLQR